MPRNDRLLRISKADKELIRRWREGVSVEADFVTPINTLLLNAAGDRWHFAYTHRKDGNRLLGLRVPSYRCAVSRYYYALYHCFRAVAYVFHGGDDFQEHTKLPTKLPTDFPNAATWANTLKSARLTRNKADYDPYPKTDLPWRADAMKMKHEVDDVLNETKQYLLQKGCTGL